MRGRIVMGGAAAMLLLVLLLLLTGRVLVDGSALLLLPASMIAGTAMAGVFATRRLGARWPEQLSASLVATVALIAITAVALPELSPFGGGSHPGAALDQGLAVLTFLAAGTMGSFALPLAEPAVRADGAAPTVWKVAVASLGVVALLAAAQVLVLPGGGPGFASVALVILAGGGAVGLAAAGTGVLLTLIGRRATGAWIGGLGLLTALLSALIWVAGGTPWFP